MALLTSLIGLPPASGAVLVPQNATWKYLKGTAEASSPTSAWRELSFSDAAWLSGAMPFFYGETLVGGTRFTDMQNQYGCVFLRKTFQVTDLQNIGGLDLIASCDDGFVAWINGHPVQRYNVASGKGAYTDFADGAVAEPVAAARYLLPDHRDYLLPGSNVLAVQLFNVSLASSDIVLDMQLVSVEPDPTPPVLVGFSPPAGDLPALSQVTVEFSEPVFGLDEGDLLLNGAQAISVAAGAGATYTFTYDPQPFGSIQVTWNPDHGIIDLARPGNVFDSGAPGTSWQYRVVDATAPTLIQRNPLAGRTVRCLGQVELMFSEPVTGLDPADLRVNGQPATSVSGLSAGPYVFAFAAITNGPAQVDWSPGHGIQDLAEVPNAFVGASWSYTVDPTAIPGEVVLSEFLAANETGLLDEDGEAQDWIEIQNRGATSVNLDGWSLTDDPRVPGQWTFPAVTLGSRQYLVVYASGKDRRPVGPGTRLHTNFKLSAAGEYLGLYTAESPRAVADELAPAYPEQRIDHPYARPDGTNTWRYFPTPTPGTVNGSNPLDGVTPPVHFSVARGFFSAPFNLILAVDAPAAVIRYTLDDTPPTETGGWLYAGPIHIDRTCSVRAAAFQSNSLPSSITTHTYLYGLAAGIRSLPALSLVTANSNLFGPTGIMEVNPRNTTKHGIAWERPVSVEYIQPWDHDGFDLEAGLRVQGGGYVRERYDPEGPLPFSKYSFRLYFRGDYGTRRLDFPLFPGSAVTDFDRIVLRAGMNDPSNPFVRDELVRRLFADMGQVSSHGTLTTFFLNGTYQGYYNPCERIDSDFLRSWHGGGPDWDVLAQFGEVQEGDATAWNALRRLASASDLSINAAYQDVAHRLDVTNFVDYLLVNIYPAMGDWPHNNWRAARERVPGARFRYYVWDAEWAFGYNNSVTHDTFANELSGSTEIATFYQKLHANAEFRLLFADRIHKHFFNGGALTDAHVLARFTALRTNMAAILPGMNTSIQTTWVPQRRGYVMQHCAAQGLLASANAPAFNQHGGRVRRGFELTLSAAAGAIYYTTNGADPRLPFTGAVSADARLYAGAPLPLDHSLVVRARTRNGSNWSALTEAAFTVAEVGSPLRITEIMYQPPDGNAFEFVELFNAGTAPVNLSLLQFVGIDFQFADNTFLAPGSFLVLASDDDPAAFAARYPGLPVAGHFAGSLSNGGEKLALVDPSGHEIAALTYDDAHGWPLGADGLGYSLETVDLNGDPNAPANWRASLQPGGSPAALPAAEPPASAVVLNELMAENLTAVPHAGAYPDWVELFNGSSMPVGLDGWRLRDEGNEFVFPTGTSLATGQHLVVWCDTNSSAPGLHSGFNLGRTGDSLVLEDSSGRRVDALTFGLQIADLALGRFGHDWSLAEPTPGTANTELPLASQASLRLNEWLANSPPGGDDWVELFNGDPSNAVSLRDLGFTTTAGAAFQLRALSFIPSRGHVLLRADGNPGADHLGFKLPATGTRLVLYDETGTEVDQATIGVLPQGVSAGRLPDGAANTVSFPATPSPGAANYVPSYSGPLLNEILARNDTTITNAAGRFADWVELYNPTPTAFDLSAMRLGRDRQDPAPWPFPAGSVIPGNGHFIVWFDDRQPASTTLEPELHTGHGLQVQGGGVFLFDASGQVVDAVDYGLQAADLSIGRSGGAWRLLAQPTPGAANAAAAPLGPTTGLCLNEWMADPVRGPDWFELYNPDTLPVSLGGLHLSDDPSIIGAKKHRIPDLSFIAAHGWVKWEADGAAEDGADHVNFSLSRFGQTLRLNDAAGALIDGVDSFPQPAGVSDGRLPDGATDLVRFVNSPTPGAANYLPHPALVINEVLSHSDPPFEDAIELLNLADSAIDLGGYYLSDDPANLEKFQIPAGTIIDAHGFQVFYEHQFNGGAGSLVPFSLNSARGDTVHLAEPDLFGELIGCRAVAEFGPSANGVSLGRVATSVGWDFAPLDRSTFGVSQPSSLADFRAGTGAANAGPRLGPVVISEILYHPLLSAGPPFVEADQDEFVELENPGPDAVPLYDLANPQNTWRLDDGIEYRFPTGSVLSARSRLLVVNFDPISDASAVAAFRTRYAVPSATPLLGPFVGRLDNEADTVGLYRPDPPQPVPGPDAGLVPYVLVERIAYTNGFPWPEAAHATGWSLQRSGATLYGNDPAHWLAAAPTAGRALPTPTDTDGDGLPDAWETAHGLDRQDPTDADEDTDHDGLTNRQEFATGTDPQDPASRLRLDAVQLSATEVLLRFDTVPDRSYSVQYRDAPDSALWQKLVDVPASSTPGAREVPDTPFPDRIRFYRLVTPAQP